MPTARTRFVALMPLLLMLLTALVAADEPSFEQANSVLTKYCAGCHNVDDANGDFALDSFATLIKGGESGTALTPGSSASSRMVQMMRGKLEPTMPPADESAPSEDEIQLIADWIDSGAKGPQGQSGMPTELITPEIKPQVATRPVTALAYSGDQQKLAVGRFGEIEIRDGDGKNIIHTISNLPGKITSLTFLRNDEMLIAGTGVSGLYGEAVLLMVDDGTVAGRFRGHRDMVYSVAISQDEKWLATAGYDRKSVLWKLDSNKPVREIVGHNDAVFQNVFDRTGELLITASADATVKVWRTADAQRLDTRGEPLKEQYAVAISPDGNWFVAGGQDNRIRKWKLVSRAANQTNPLSVARFADESAIELLVFHPNGRHLISVGRSDGIKVWDFATMNQVHQFRNSTESIQALAVGKEQLIVGSMDGTLDVLKWPTEELNANHETAESNSPENVEVIATKMATPTETAESEPNDNIAEAMQVEAPFKIAGVIDQDNQTDVDSFQFTAKQGQRWVIETTAAMDKSPLDTHIAVLDAQGHAVPRVLLRAVRDSYFTFRGKDSKQTGDFRIHNWDEMKLNQLLYCNGEVVRLYHYPRGPDSGYNVFPNFGNRHGMFDTTPIAHALHEPCYIVEAHPPGSEFPATGLPLFLLNYENDDDSKQKRRTDSRLTFIAPSDGEYIVRVRDARDFSGEEFKYTLTVRAENPGFRISNVLGNKPTLIPGSSTKMGVEIEREDGFAGEVTIEVKDLPEGVKFVGPVTIEENGLRAFFTLHTDRDVSAPNPESKPRIELFANINGNKQSRSKPIGEIKIGESPKLKVGLRHAPKTIPHFNAAGIPVLEIHPGQTITANVVVNRLGHEGRINFGKEEAAVNLPFGVYVDNTGLNGVLIPPGENARTFFLTAEDWVQPCSRLIFLQAEEAGKPASNPAVLRVLSSAPTSGDVATKR